MIVVLVRHAVAVDRLVYKRKKLDDRLRPLTPKGRKKMIKIAGRLKKMISKPDCIVTSPLMRATQTAAILSRSLGCAKVEECLELSPDVTPQAFAKWLKTYGSGKKIIVLVGHEPNLGFLASWLLNGSQDSFVEFKKGGILGLELDSVQHTNYGKLLFLCQPKQLIE